MKTLQGGALFLALIVLVGAAQPGAAQTIGSGTGDASAAQDSASAKLAVDLLSDVPAAHETAIKHYIPAIIKRTREEWIRMTSSGARPPMLKQGKVIIEFVLLTDGKVGSMTLAHASGEVALDRAAWAAITSADYPAFPEGVSVPQVKLRFSFNYNGKEHA